jgi:cyclohexanecarboxylate-CoA ligase
MTATEAQPPLADLLEGQHTPFDDETVARWRAEGWWEGRTVRSG